MSIDSSSSSSSGPPSPESSPTASESPLMSPNDDPAVPNLPVSLPPQPVAAAGQDPTMVLSRKRVEEARKDNSGRVYRVYCDGVFDLFHLGHFRMLEQAKKSLGDTAKVYLLAGVCSDEDVHRFKGKTVMDHKLRCDSVRHCKWVDEVLEDAPWVIEESYLKKYNIDFVAHDAIPYQDNSGVAADSKDVYAYVKSKGMFLETQRTEGLSTSDLIVNIIRDYDEYVIRNLSRGYSKKDLNIGNSWEVRSRFHAHAKRVKEGVAKTKSNARETQDAAMSFISEFNPKYLLRRKSVPATAGYGPSYFMKRLKENLPQKRNELWHHSIGLAFALFETTKYIASYVNPFSYCGKRSY